MNTNISDHILGTRDGHKPPFHSSTAQLLLWAPKLPCSASSSGHPPRGSSVASQLCILQWTSTQRQQYGFPACLLWALVLSRHLWEELELGSYTTASEWVPTGGGRARKLGCPQKKLCGCITKPQNSTSCPSLLGTLFYQVSWVHKIYGSAVRHT